MIGRRATSGSDAIRFRNVTIACSESSMPSSMLTSMICAPFSTCCRATWRRPLYSHRPRSGAGKSRSRSRCNVHRHSRTDRPDRCSAARGLTACSEPATRARRTRCNGRLPHARIAAMCSGRVVPQQPPTRLTSPDSANSPTTVRHRPPASRRIRRIHSADRRSGAR